MPVFLKRVAGLARQRHRCRSAAPLVVVIALSMLNLEHVVFSLMSGIQEADRSPNDAAYGIVFMLSMLSFIAAPFLAVGYLVSIVNANEDGGGLEMTAGSRDD
ncbi:MAG: hypothetical protein IPG33_02875 [Betaproteobacteria bacterium]|nr:hypothetical protein [Betaproteobacteria bacterium]